MRRQTSGRRRPGQPEQVEALEIGGVETNELRDGVAHEHRLRADVAQRLVQRLQEVAA